MTDIFADLTEREFGVLTLVCNGNSVENIAGILTLTPRSVQSYLNTIYSKLDISGNRDYNQNVKAARMYKDLYRYGFVRRYLGVEPLTPRESAVLQLLAQGYSNSKIASELVTDVSSCTVIIKSVYDKLGISSRDPDVDVRVLAMLMSDRIDVPTDRRRDPSYRV